MTVPTVPGQGPYVIDVTALPPAKALWIGTAGGVEGMIYTRPCLLAGWSISNYGSSAASWALKDGPSATGLAVAGWNLAAGTMHAIWLGFPYVMVYGGLQAFATGGPLNGSVYVIDPWE